MDFTMFEDAVLHEALAKYIAHCKKCANLPDNSMNVKLAGEIEVAESLLAKVNAHYLSVGGRPEWLEGEPDWVVPV